MTWFNRTPLLRWLVPVAVAALLVGGSVAISAVTASAGDAGLPPRTAAQLLVDLEQSKVGSLSGTVVQSSDLGIPSLPGIGGTSSSDLASLISGTHTLRVWYDGSDKARVALLGSLGESDVIKNGSDVWTWSSQDNTATHSTMGTAQRNGKPLKPGTGLDPTDLPKTPADAAGAVLKAIDPTTLVSTDGTQAVAGRPVYQLTLRPRDTRSLISRVSIAIDATEHIPLRLQVFAVGHADPAFAVAFTSVDFATPDPSEFVFNPPPGAVVTQGTPGVGAVIPGGAGKGDPKPDSGSGSARSDAAPAKLVGTGWTSVLVTSTSSLPAGGQLGRVLTSLPKVSGAWGSGRLFSGTLFSAVLSDDGRMAVGAVAPDLLYAALAAK